jgi:hypothetical protein
MSIDGAVETWSRQVLRPEDLPEACAALLPGLFETFPYCVRSPAMRSLRISEPETFLFLEETRLVIMKRRRTGVAVFQADFSSIDALETETTLLHSCLTVHPRHGQPERVPFNTVMEQLYVPVVAAYRRARSEPVPAAERLRALRPNPFQDLLKRDYKYYTYAFLVLPDDAVRARFYHPAAFVPGFVHWLRLIPSYLLVASGSMLYSFSEKEPFRRRNRADYSLLVRYLPLSSGLTAGLQPVAGEHRYRLLTLQTGATRFEIPLARTLEDDFGALARLIELKER